MATCLFETYVKSNTSKIYPHLQRHRQLFETYVKLLPLKLKQEVKFLATRLRLMQNRILSKTMSLVSVCFCRLETCVKWSTSKTLSYDVIEFETYVKSFTSKAFGGDYIDFCWFEIYVKRSTSKTSFSNRFWNCQFGTYVKSFTLLSPFRPVIWVLFFAIHAKQMHPNHSQGKISR